MVESMKTVAKMVEEGTELSVEERNLLSVAYKNVIGARRASWRIISSIEAKEESKGNQDHVSRIRKYRATVEEELQKICNSILELLDTYLIPTAATGESKVFYLKMKGDYHRYLAEFKTGQDREEAAEATMLAYKAAQVRRAISRNGTARGRDARPPGPPGICASVGRAVKADLPPPGAPAGHCAVRPGSYAPYSTGSRA